MVNKNRIVLSSLVVLLIILGVIYFVSGSFTAAPVSNYTTNLDNSPAMWTTAGGSEIFNMTLNWTVDGSTATLDDYNITSINVTIPPLFNISTITINTSFGFIAPNGTTLRPIDPYFGNWRWNLSAVTNRTIIIYELNVTENIADGFGNATVYLWFNFTADSTVANETNATITVLFMNNTNKSVAAVNQLTFSHGIDGAAPRLSFLNITDGTGTNSTGFNHTSDINISWMKLNSSMNISVNLMVDDANADTAIMCYSSNVSTNVSELCRTTQVGSTNATMTRALDNSTSAVFTYMWNSDNFTNATQTMSFIFYVNDTLGRTVWFNNSNAMYKFKTDGGLPSPTITISDEDKIIKTTNSITLTCAGTDALSGVKSYSLVITKPNTETVTYTDSDDHVFTDTGSPGTHEVACTLTDRAGHSATASDSFLVLYSSTNAGAEGGGGGTTFSVDVDFSKEGVTEKYFTKGEGSIVDFSLDGSTKHTIEFTKVTEKAVTLTIASTPQVITLMIGEIKEVDVDGNGINDITVKLESISNGVARVRASSIVEGVEAAKAGAGKEEKKEETPPGTPTTPTETGPGTIPKAPNGKTGLIIAVAIIVIGVVIYFVAFRKKK